MNPKIVSIHARRIRDLTLARTLPNESEAFEQIKIPAGNFPNGFDGAEAVSISQLTNIIGNYIFYKPVADFEDKIKQVIDELIKLGNTRGFATEQELKAWTPDFNGATAKADDTKIVYRYDESLPENQRWVSTGLSEFEQSKNYVDNNKNFKTGILTSEDNLDNITEDGYYSAASSIANVELNYPIAEAGNLQVGLIGSVSKYQKYVTLSGKVYIRTKSVNWTAWKIQGVDLSNPKLTTQLLPSGTNLNDITTHGTYSFTAANANVETLNFPYKDNGTLQVERAGNGSITQIVFCMIGRMYVRFKSASWGTWFEIPTANRLPALLVDYPKLTTSPVGANIDLNTLTTHGVYSISSTNYLENLNYPIRDSGTLYVDRVGNASVSQLFLGLTGRIFLRFKSVNWNEWLEFVSLKKLSTYFQAEELKQAEKLKESLKAPKLDTVTSVAYVVAPVSPTGEVLNPILSKNPDRKIAIASVTKIMTCLIALESNISLDTEVTIQPEDIVTGSGFNFFKESDVVTLRDCLYGMMLPSANIAALATARVIKGSVDAFVTSMNEKAAALGMTSTLFKNPTGLSATDQTTTANDLVKLMKAALDNEVLRSIWGELTYTYTASGETRTIESSLVAVQQHKPWVLGGKTGTLGSICNQTTAINLPNGYTGIVVQLSAPNSDSRAADVETLALNAINNFIYPSVTEITPKLY